MRVAALGCLVLLGGCVSVTDPVQVGKDTYLITSNAHGGLSSNGELKTKVLARAGSFCRAQGKELEVRSTESSGVQGWTPQNNEVVFACLGADDSGYTRPTYLPNPHVIVHHEE